jgi:hypothetical protein
MKAIIGNAMHLVVSATWQVLLAVAVLSTGCGARGLASVRGDAAVASGGEVVLAVRRRGRGATYPREEAVVPEEQE